MYQEVVLSSTFIELIENEYNQFDFNYVHDVLKQLSKEEIVIDSEGRWMQQVNQFINNSDKKQSLQAFFAGWKQAVRIKKVSPAKKVQQNKFTDKLLAYETDLCLNTKDKILLRNQINLLQKQQLINEYNIELADFKEYVNPDGDSRILASARVIELEKGQPFDITNFFWGYTQNITYLIIQDGYLFNENRSWTNLKKLLSQVDPAVKVHIKTLTDEARNGSRKENDNIKTEKKLLRLKEKFGFANFQIQLKSKAEVHARKIETDYFMIHLGEGLDFVYNDPRTGNSSVSKNSIITILEKKKVD